MTIDILSNFILADCEGMSPDLTHHPKQAKKIDVLLDLYHRKSVEVEAEGFKQVPGEQKFRQKN